MGLLLWRGSPIVSGECVAPKPDVSPAEICRPWVFVAVGEVRAGGQHHMQECVHARLRATAPIDKDILFLQMEVQSDLQSNVLQHDPCSQHLKQGPPAPSL